jgi:hypothetical protein
MFGDEKLIDNGVPVKRESILVVAYAERIECFIQYLKKQEQGTAVSIVESIDGQPQSHYSINLVVKNGEDSEETVEIIYVKYQDNTGFEGLTAGVDIDVKYAFIGGDLYDKKDVRAFLENGGVIPDHTFVTPCAYNIDTAGTSGEADCQKRKFKKSVKQKFLKVISQSDEKTPITKEKNTFGYNVDFFNAVVQNDSTKQCVNRPFILLQFPLLISWFFKYSLGDLQSSNAIMSSKIIEMFKTSSEISSSLMNSLRIPAAQMIADRASFNANQVQENKDVTQLADASPQIIPESETISTPENTPVANDVSPQNEITSQVNGDKKISEVIAEAIQRQSESQQTFTEIDLATTAVPREKMGEPSSPSVQQQTGGDLVGFDSNINKNNCYLNAMFQMLCRIKGLKEEMVESLDNISKNRITTGGDDVPNPEYEIANIFQKYNQASLLAQTSQTVFLETNDVIGMKTIALNGENALKDNQESISDFLNKQTFCENDDACMFNKYLYINETVGQYYFHLQNPENEANADAFTIPDNIPDGDAKQMVTTQQKPYLIFYFERVVMVQLGQKKATTKVTANGEINMGGIKYVKKGAIIHLGESTRSGHYIYVSYKKRDNNTYAIDKMYNNSNVIVFNDDNTRFLAQHLPNKQIVELFESEMGALIDRINQDENVNKIANKEAIIQNFTDAAVEIASSDILKLAQYDDIKECFVGINAQMDEDVGNASEIGKTKETVIEYFRNTPYAEILKKDIAAIEEDIAQNAVFFLYERVDNPIEGGTNKNKKKSWSRSRRMRKMKGQSRVSLKRLNKMKQERHPSIKHRSSSLKK